jgi:hypothetical protein
MALALVVLSLGAQAPAAASGTIRPKPPCRDGDYKLNSSRWTTPLRWQFRAFSTPKGMSREAAGAALRRAAANVVNGRNSCRLADTISATEQYMGRTKARTNIEDDSTCGRPDGKSVLGFGVLAPTDMAITCWWTLGAHTVEADIKFNKAFYQWVTKVRAGCVASWSIEAVATHEFGHAFGLDHVSEDLHGNLTMSPLIAPCENAEATLGLGDVRGLRAKY